MNGALLLLIAVALFAVGYFVYARYIEKLLGIDPKRPTPAHTKNDGVDFVPASSTVLFGHHFATIAGAGPIVGPVLAAQFGWLSVTMWVVLGCIFIGALHDMISLFLSVRNSGESIGSVIGTLLGRPGKIMFLLVSWTGLVLVIAEFNRQIAGTFIADPATATSSLLFIVEAILFGLCVYKWRISVVLASLIFVPLMFVFVWIGNVIPFDLVKLLGITPDLARIVWILFLLLYCFIASTCPVQFLLQPRDYLNAYLLYVMMALGILGVLVAHPVLNIDAFAGFSAVGKSGASDASAEAMAHVRSVFDKAGIIWQVATMGKVDQGGGGTVAAYMANRNIVTVDAGVPVLAMHAPMEIVSKLDCYQTFLACKAIYLA